MLSIKIADKLFNLKMQTNNRTASICVMISRKRKMRKNNNCTYNKIKKKL